ncbi:glycosyltransferase family 2 protein [Bacillus sp. AG4(2022)]|uniref:glycosyltransferase family 2 protein n=1 Tax=Bacillus sp. AG4(2022) TaxID=2962594 RepID=UPI0028821254|nr:glycosyltransferase family 2 protein [Bacillus sp. AG4(2022)]MDT0161597.1 glycosyltransferase family 2 protein [Bacillus sp. AG4(2022)]
MKSVCIILLNYNGTTDTIACIESIERLDVRNLNTKVVIIDNNSEHDQCKKLESYLNDNQSYNVNNNLSESKYILLKNKMNLGFAGANNKAIRFAEEHYDFDYYLLLNNDTELREDSLQKLIIAFNDTEVGAASGLILDYASKSKIWYAGGYVSRIRAKGKHEFYGQDVSTLDLRAKTTKFLSGCFVMFDRKALLDIQLLNERYFFGTEEYDYSLKLRDLGYKLMFIPESVIYHKVKIDEGNGSSHNIKELIFIYNSMRNKYLLNYFNYNVITKNLWVLFSKFYIKYILYRRLSKNGRNDLIDKESVRVLYDYYIKNISKKFIDYREFNEVREKLKKID